jgi:uncharacterized membrane protein
MSQNKKTPFFIVSLVFAAVMAIFAPIGIKAASEHSDIASDIIALIITAVAIGAVIILVNIIDPRGGDDC